MIYYYFIYKIMHIVLLFLKTLLVVMQCHNNWWHILFFALCFQIYIYIIRYKLSSLQVFFHKRPIGTNIGPTSPK